jgi:hypothetical protein
MPAEPAFAGLAGGFYFSLYLILSPARHQTLPNNRGLPKITAQAAESKQQLFNNAWV